jgi:hypothetical protein
VSRDLSMPSVRTDDGFESSSGIRQRARRRGRCGMRPGRCLQVDAGRRSSSRRKMQVGTGLRPTLMIGMQTSFSWPGSGREYQCRPFVTFLRNPPK